MLVFSKKNNTKINEIEKKITDHDDNKYINAPEFNKFATEMFDLRLKRANLASKSDIASFVKKPEAVKDFTLNKNELNELSEKGKVILTKGLTKDLIDKFSILNGPKYFSLGIFQNYSVFILTKKYIKYFSGFTWVESWKSNVISEESIENISKSDTSFC